MTPSEASARIDRLLMLRAVERAWNEAIYNDADMVMYDGRSITPKHALHILRFLSPPQTTVQSTVTGESVR